MSTRRSSVAQQWAATIMADSLAPLIRPGRQNNLICAYPREGGISQVAQIGGYLQSISEKPRSEGSFASETCR
jgi:hypothetical protein